MLSDAGLNNTSHFNETVRQNFIQCRNVRDPLFSKLIPNRENSIMFLSGLENSVKLKAIPEAANSCVTLKYILDTFSTNWDYHNTQKVKRL